MPVVVKSTEPAKLEPIAPDQPKTVRVMIHPRRSAVYQTQIGVQTVDGKDVPVMAHRTALGGSTIEVSIQDAEHMRTHGFLQEATTEDAPLATGQSSTIYGQEERSPTINGDDNRIVRGA